MKNNLTSSRYPEPLPLAKATGCTTGALSRLIGVLVCWAIAFPLHAQALKIGIGTGFHAPFPVSKDALDKYTFYRPKATVPLQILVDFALTGRLAIQSELNVQQVYFGYVKSGNKSHYYWDTGQISRYSYRKQKDYRYRSIEIPVLLKWCIGRGDIWLDMMAGPSIGWNVPGNVYDLQTIDQQVVVGEIGPMVIEKDGFFYSPWNPGSVPMRRMFFNAHGGAQLGWEKAHYTFFANTRLLVGLTDLRPDSHDAIDAKLRSSLRYFALTGMVGVMYHLK